MWWLVGRTAMACAGLVHEPDALAESDSAEAVFELAAVGSRVTYEVAYDGDAADFGWVVPVMGEVTAVADGDPALLENLRGWTAPLVEDLSAEESGGCGCGAKSSDKAGGTRNVSTVWTEVDVVAEGFTGTYEYQVVRSTDAAALTAWMGDHGFTGLDPTDVDHYVELGADFVVLLLTPDEAATPTGGRSLPPIAFDYDGTEAVFPSVMARHAAVETQRTTVYVIGEDRAAVSGWTSADLTAIRGEGDPVSLYEDAIRALGTDRSFGRTWAGRWQDQLFLTRFDTIAPRGVHDRDAVFATGDGTDALWLTVSVEGRQDSGSALLLAPLALVGWALRRLRASAARR